MWVFRAILLVTLIAALAGFLVYNITLDQRVAVDLYWRQYENVPLLIVIFWSFISGVILSLIFFIVVYLKQLAQISSARRIVKGLHEEVSALRNRPIEESRGLFEKGLSEEGLIESKKSTAAELEEKK